MIDGCTNSEAEKLLERGTKVFEAEDFENNLYCNTEEWKLLHIPKENFFRLLKRGKFFDLSTVTYNGFKFYIMYVRD